MEGMLGSVHMQYVLGMFSMVLNECGGLLVGYNITDCHSGRWCCLRGLGGGSFLSVITHRDPLEGCLGLQLCVVRWSKGLRWCCFNGQPEYDVFAVFLVVDNGDQIEYGGTLHLEL